MSLTNVRGYCVLRIAVTVVCFALVLGLSMSGAGVAQTTSQRILSVTTEIIRNAAVVGLEEAGVRLLGPTAWRFLKTAADPVFDELKRQFPGLFGARTVGSEKARLLSERASDALLKQTSLRNLLLENILNLGKGQQKILDEINNIDRELAKLGSSLERMQTLDTANTNRVLEELRRMRQGGRSLEEVDRAAGAVDAIRRTVETYDVKTRGGDPNKLAAAGKIAMALVKVAEFDTRVSEEGRVGRGYRKVIEGVEYKIWVQSETTNEFGRVACRVLVVANSGKIRWLPKGKRTYCKHGSGNWLPESMVKTK